ncbi:DUF6603 domain-containing protein [Streptomyces sp. I05A-00742]|uniref:DUF6603 domain-containing protein n=1 Tax=Streptomyces sp. I05A-00742 TaxID=2732853 RepID=UPI00148938B1|nr:DUF6603 domain-containing protein [Streptomyces sp. I05A-00742]
MSEDVWDELPVELVPKLTSASLRLELAAGKGGFAMGIILSGTADTWNWQVGAASADDGTGRTTLVAASVDPQVTLAQLPVVGPRLPAHAGTLSRLSLLVRSGGTAPGAELTRRLQELLTGVRGPVVRLSPEVVAHRAVLGVEATVASGEVPVWLGLGGGKAGLPGPEPVGRPGTEATHPPPDGRTGTGIAVWADVNRALGPLQLHRVGVSYSTAGKRLMVLVDASLGAMGLVFDAVGLGLGVALDGSFAVSGTLDGLGLTFEAGPVRVAGALVRDSSPPDPLTLLIGGMLTVTTPRIGFLAAGMYGQLRDGRASVFVIGSVTGLHVPLGPVELTGLLGGFGYNSSLALPATPQEVDRCPLVAGIGDESVLPVHQGAAAALKKLQALIIPAGDHVWVAAGAQFTVFELVEAAVVVAMEISPGDLTIAVLGTARVRFPRNDSPYVSLMLGLSAVYRYSTGELSLQGALDPAQSYLVSRDCRVQGGFALCTWVPPSGRAGDFVITFGGYHPGYRPPSHYPQAVDRIGVVWQPSSAVVVRGEAYAAVTPSMLQVGGALRVEYNSDVVSAWLRAEMNATVQWEPFRFEVMISVHVGVEIRFLGTHRLELGVDLTLWGPPTGGVARLELPVVPDLWIRFGPGRPSDAAALSWDEFRGRVLGSRSLEAAVAGGLLPEQQQQGPGSGQPQKVTLQKLTLSVRTPVPCTRLRVEGTQSTYKDITGSATATVPVRPMSRAAVTTHCALTMSAKGAGTTVDLRTWDVSGTEDNVPAAVWGPPLAPGTKPPVAPGEELLTGQVTGALLEAPTPTCPDPYIGPIPAGRLEDEHGPNGVLPEQGEPPFGEVPVAGTRRKVADTIDTEGTAQARDRLYERWKELGLAPGDPGAPPLDPLDGYTRRLWSFLTDDPLLVPSPGRQ